MNELPPTRDRIREAFDALLREGRRPTQGAINAWLRQTHGVGASVRDISPVVRELRQRHMTTKAIATVVARYASLDPLQRLQARKLIEAVDDGANDTTRGERA